MLPTLAEVRNAAQVDPTNCDDATLAELYAGELANQRKVCRVPIIESEYSADLRLAIYRRVARACALRAIPLGFVTSPDGFVAGKVSDLDSDIRRYERPWRKWSVG